jgi:hypothetical protein
VLGPSDGRYVLRGHAGEAEYVLVLETIGGEPRRGRLRRRRAATRSVAPEPPPPTVPVTRATLIGASPMGGADVAADWLASADLAAEVHAAVAVLNAVLHAERLVRADPYVREVAAEQALTIRVGVGRGEEVAHGHWTDARSLPFEAVATERRSHALRPQERFAALLAGRDVALAAEELTLRARLDLDRGRTREAALQLRVALEAALAELQRDASLEELADRLEDLRERRTAIGTAANEALEGELDPASAAAVAETVDRLEAALRARTAGGV